MKKEEGLKSNIDDLLQELNELVIEVQDKVGLSFEALVAYKAKQFIKEKCIPRSSVEKLREEATKNPMKIRHPNTGIEENRLYNAGYNQALQDVIDGLTPDQKPL